MKKHLITTLLVLFCSATYAQDMPSEDDTRKDKKSEKNVELSLMPFFSYNRTLEFMFGVIPMAMYNLDKNDEKSSPSLSGLSAGFSTNGSYFVGFFNRWYFDEDNWRGKLFLGFGDYSSQIFVDDLPTPDFVDYGTDFTYFTVGLQRKIVEGLYGGLGYTYAKYKTSFDLGLGLEDEMIPEIETRTNGLEFNFLYDSRDDQYYPFKGFKYVLRWITFPDAFGNDNSVNKIYAQLNNYFPARKGKDVIAARFSGKFGLGDLPFQQQVTIGGRDIRGYSESKFRGEGLMALQGEYRYNFTERVGMVGFAGIATIYGSTNEDFDWKAYPGAGAGIRYGAFKGKKFNIGLDAAVGKDDWGIYFRIGEAF